MARSRGSNAAGDMAALRGRDPGFVCSYCCCPLALPLPQAGTEHLAWERDGWELHLDVEGEATWQLVDGAAMAHRDHVHPFSKGGANTLDNLVLACEACNAAKRARPLLLFLALRAGCPRYKSVHGNDHKVFARTWAA